MAVTNLRVVCKIITCASVFTEMAGHIYLEIINTKSCCRSGHSVLQATRRTPLWALAIALSTGKNTRLFVVLDQNKTRFFTYVSQHAESNQKLSRRAISRGSFTVAGDFVLQLIRLESLGSELNRANYFHSMADKFALCSDRK